MKNDSTEVFVMAMIPLVLGTLYILYLSAK